MAYKWDAEDYAASSPGQQQWARELIGKLCLEGHESVLDIGSGDGKVTAEIAASVPGGSVLGIDNSSDMIALSRSRYPESNNINLRFEVADAAALPFQDQFDIVFSNATLHWVINHRPVLTGIARSLKTNGRVLLQMGGKGNAAKVIKAIDSVCNRTIWSNYFQGFGFPYGFYEPGEYCQWMANASLPCNRVELIPKDMVHADANAFEGWLRTTWLPYTQRIPCEKRSAFLRQVVETYLEENPAYENGTIHVQMVRLEVESKKE
jgi:trans-aconitate 2-methyltransferase